MQTKPLPQNLCPIARTVATVADYWSVLILREAFHGVTRFDEFQHNLGIAPNMLTRRLNSLVEQGMLVRRRYCDRPPRSEYILTDRGHDFRPVLLAMLAWANKHLAPAPAGAPSTQVDYPIAPGAVASG